MNAAAEKIKPDTSQEAPLSDEELFAEEVDRRSGVETDEGEKPEGKPTEIPAAAVEKEAAPTTDKPAVDATTADATPGKPESEAPKGDTSAEAETLPAWYEELSESAKKAYDDGASELAKLQQQYTAISGRLAPVQRENARLRDQLAALGRGQRPGAPPAGPPPAATGAAPPAASPVAPVQGLAPLDLNTVKIFADYKAEFPEDAKVLEAAFGLQAKHISHLEDQLGNVQKGFEQIQSVSFGQERERSLSRLAEAHSDWMTIHPSEDFANWLGQQPASVAAMANSEDPDECIFLLDRYKQDVYMLEQQAVGSTPATPQDPTTTSPAQALRQRRKQLRSVPGIDPQPSDVGVPQGSPDEFMTDEDLWTREVDRRLRAQRDNQR